MSKIKVTLIKSPIGFKLNQKRTVEALGLRKLNSFRIHEENDAIKGMIFTVKHLVKVEEVKEEKAKKPAAVKSKTEPQAVKPEAGLKAAKPVEAKEIKETLSNLKLTYTEYGH